MKISKIAILGLFIFFGISSEAQTDGISKNQFKEKVEIPVDMGYLLYKPEGYKNSKKDYPLIVFLHGAGERGTDLQKVKVNGPFQYLKDGNEIDAVILAPQCPEGTYWQPDEVAGLIKKIIKEEHIDPSRVYLTGLSMGGYGVWATGGKYPELFAAMAPVCGAIYRPIYRNAQHLKTMPIWVFHGAMDDVVLPENSNNMVMALKQAGNADVKYTIYPFANHNSWTETYNNPELYDWLLSQEKKK
ncbi:prolyl oligopeptidase family serine peptidase [Zunongwangia sp. HRR-M8]|uniref:carboxylesterase family protein n=1 Tax=Zunongwangia sp. HRR-M8 TaxID=3015170 RepID=UPI0022DCE466|nr:prolyl oligopeptidase family serine peptidase [Zunongwangia sp. HRR-M8]WBL23062.1 prolyl oligopeptidase family serine peptidase [Zunongwangia sp. HRR-M8]